MELPAPPDDPELKNIIDKLANFVARNGPEFENMTKQKQKDNPKFSFLYGGEFFNYYQYKVTTEQQYWSPHKDSGTNRLQPVTSQLADINLTSRLLDFHGGVTKTLAKPMTVTMGTQIDRLGPFVSSPALKKVQQQAAQQAIQSLPWQQASQMQQPPVSMAPQIVSSPFQSLQQAPSPITTSQLPPHSVPLQSPQLPASIITSAGLQTGVPMQVPTSLQSVGPLQPGGQLQSGGVLQTMVPMQTGPQLQHGASLQSGFTIQPGGPQLQPGGPQLQPGGPQLLPPDQLQQQISVLQQQIQQHQNMMDQQIKQSEQNLSAQYNSLMQQQQSQIDDAILQTQNEKIATLYHECEIVEEEFDRAVQPIIESCTKDAILNGKSWIFQKAITDQHRTLVAQYLLKRITSNDASFELRLHLIYLINDLLHHCQRKNADDMKKELESVVVPIFCISLVGTEEEKKTKLNKLLTLWEQNKYFEDDTIKLMREPSQSLSAYKDKLLQDHASIVSQITTSIQQQYNSLQKQHQDFVNHMNMTQQQLQQQLQIMTSQQQQSQTAVSGIPPNVVTSLPPGVTSVVTVPSSQAMEVVSSVATVSVVSSLVSPTSVAMTMPTTSLAGQGPPPGSMSLQDMPPGSSAPNYTQAPAITTSQYQPSFSIHTHGFGAPHLGFQRPPLPAQFDFSQPPPTHGPGIIPPDFLGPPPQGPPQFALPDLSKPPPGYTGGPIPGGGFPPMLPPEIDLTPSVPYYELPAGLMAPLIKLEDFDYKPLDPKDIRLPPPMPPSERLLRAVEAFYSSPHHDRPRDSEGWEKLGLYEFFKAKQMAKKRKDREGDYRRSRSSSRSLSKSPSPTPSPPPSEIFQRSRSPPSVRGDRNDSNSHSPAVGHSYNSGHKRRSYSRSRSHSRSRSRSNSGSRSGSGSYSPSRSISKSESRSRSRSRSGSRSGSKSPLPYLPSSKSPSPVRRHRKSKSRSRSRSRSATPPTFSTEAFLAAAAAANTSSQPPSSENRIGHENKGHQLLKKMGWSGKGLGASEQGIVEPISGGEVRDRQDMYKGVGHDFGDPFEQFRKNKSLGFIQRMKARDEQRELKRKSTDSS